MSNVKFVVSHMDEQLGPFDEQELRSKWTAGEILPIDYVYDEEKADWILVAERFAWAQAHVETAPPPVKTETLVVRKAAPAPTPTLTPAPELEAEPEHEEAEPEPPRVEFVPVPKAKKETPAITKIKLVDGFGEIDLSPLIPGHVEVQAKDANAANLKAKEPLHIDIKPAEPVEVVWSLPNQQTAGEEVEISIRALDENGNVCLHYTDDFVIQVRGNTDQDLRLKTHDGEASLKLSHTKAEMWSVSLQYRGTKRLKLPATRMVEWQPGEPTRLVIDGPQEYTAGLPLKVQVKAVDDYGNVAKNYQGTVVLEVKAS